MSPSFNGAFTDLRKAPAEIDLNRSRTPSPERIHVAFLQGGSVGASRIATTVMSATGQPPSGSPLSSVTDGFCMVFMQPIPVIALPMSVPLSNFKDNTPYSNLQQRQPQNQHEKTVDDFMQLLPDTPRAEAGSEKDNTGSANSVASNEDSGNVSSNNSPAQPDTMCSVGSVGHPYRCGGACKYNTNSKAGCKEGAACTRCHLCYWTRASERGVTRTKGNKAQAKANKRAKAFRESCF